MTHNPAMTRLLIEVHHDAIDVVTMSKAAGGELSWQHMPLAVTDDVDAVKAFEALVYDHPDLLADYASINVLFDTDRFMVVPANRADDDSLRAMVDALWPDADLDIVTTPADGPDTIIACAVPRRMLAFVRRTFSQARVSHRMAPLCRYFALGNLMRNTGKVHVHLHHNRMDIIAFAGQNLLMANTFTIGGNNDALYYVMAAARQLNFDVRTDQVLVSGDASRRDALMRSLRRYFANVMPAIFPADMFSAGSDAMRAPFELIITPLCE